MQKTLILIAMVLITLIMGCSQEKGQPVQTQSQQQQPRPQTAVSPPVSQEFTFRGLRFDIPIEQQMKRCETDKDGLVISREICFKPSRSFPLSGIIHNLSELEVYVGDPDYNLKDSKIESVEMSFRNGEYERVTAMMKNKFGEPTNMIQGYEANAETVTLKWNYNGFEITQIISDPRQREYGKIILKTPGLVQLEKSKQGKL